jgi:glycosyltransferase involved in cell wall biosynthesis
VAFAQPARQVACEALDAADRGPPATCDESDPHRLILPVVVQMTAPPSTPTVSVLVPTCARPALLARALDSALEQELAPLEVIVGDETGEAQHVVEARPDRRLVYVRNPSRLGMGANVTSLCDRARGDLLLVLNDDDRLDPRFLAVCVERYCAMPDLGVVFANHVIERAGATRLRKTRLRAGRHDEFGVALARHNPVPISAALFRAEAWRDARPLPDTGSADFVLWARIAEHGWAFYFVDEPLMTYMSHPAGLSAGPEHTQDAIAAFEAVRFRSPEAERLRARRIADALLTRASRRIAAGELRAARADVARVHGMAGRTPRSSLLGAVAGGPRRATAATALARRVAWRPWR